MPDLVRLENIAIGVVVNRVVVRDGRRIEHLEVVVVVDDHPIQRMTDTALGPVLDHTHRQARQRLPLEELVEARMLSHRPRALLPQFHGVKGSDRRDVERDRFRRHAGFDEIPQRGQ